MQPLLAIVPFVSERVDAGEEFKALDNDAARYFLARFAKPVLAGTLDVRPLRPYCEVSGIPAFKVDHARGSVVCAVLANADGSLKIVVLAAISGEIDRNALKRMTLARLEDYLDD